MNHLKIYNSIIESAKSENRIKSKEVYYEKHHIIPKCMKGSDDEDNLVLLTAKEHFICHKLLTYIYLDNRKIALAYYRMVYGQQGKLLNLSSRDYEYAKEIRYKTKQKSHFEIWKKKYGIIEALRREEEKKEKIKNTMTGRKYSKERIEKAANGHIGLKQSEETINKRILKTTNQKRIKVKCEYCDKEFGINAYKSYHGDKCKKKII